MKTVLGALRTRDWTGRRESIEWQMDEALILARDAEAKDSSCRQVGFRPAVSGIVGAIRMGRQGYLTVRVGQFSENGRSPRREEAGEFARANRIRLIDGGELETFVRSIQSSPPVGAPPKPSLPPLPPSMRKSPPHHLPALGAAVRWSCGRRGEALGRVSSSGVALPTLGAKEPGLPETDTLTSALREPM
jgi:hypothetical protein